MDKVRVRFGMVKTGHIKGMRNPLTFTLLSSMLLIVRVNGANYMNIMNIYIVRKPVGIMLLAALFAPVCRLEAKTLDYLPRNESIEISSTSKAVIKGDRYGLLC